jgi:hypothetical protein
MTSAYCAGSFNFWKWWTIRPDIEARSLRKMRKVEEVHSDMGSGAGIADVSDTQVEGRTACNRVEI